MQAFNWVSDRYQKAELNEGRLLFPEVELSLGMWQGSFNRINRFWLRWMTLEGDLIPTPEEKEAIAKQEAAVAKQPAINGKEEAAALKEELAAVKKQSDADILSNRE